MSFTYKLARRLAQAHLVAASLLMVSCGSDGSPVSESAPSSPPQGDAAPGSVTSPQSVFNTNEPSGYMVISDRLMNAKVESGWTDRGDNEFSIVAEPTAPRSPANIGRALFKTGYKGGGGPIQTDLSLRGKSKKEVYISFWLKFSPSFVGAWSSGVNKVLHFWIDGGSKIIFSGYGQGSASFIPQMRLQNIAADSRGVSFNLGPNLKPGIRMKRNQWYHIEIALTANTPGQADGAVKWWMDGSAVGSYSNVGYVGQRKSPFWEEVSWAPTWGTPSDRVPASMYMYMDHVYVSGR